MPGGRRTENLAYTHDGGAKLHQGSAVRSDDERLYSIYRYRSSCLGSITF
jgi:hypothetical protein